MPETAMCLTGPESLLDNYMISVGLRSDISLVNFICCNREEGKRSRVVSSRYLWAGDPVDVL